MSEPDAKFKRKSGTEIYALFLCALVVILFVLWVLYIVWKVLT